MWTLYKVGNHTNGHLIVGVTVTLDTEVVCAPVIGLAMLMYEDE